MVLVSKPQVFETRARFLSTISQNTQNICRFELPSSDPRTIEVIHNCIGNEKERTSSRKSGLPTNKYSKHGRVFCSSFPKTPKTFAGSSFQARNHAQLRSFTIVSETKKHALPTRVRASKQQVFETRARFVSILSQNTQNICWFELPSSDPRTIEVIQNCIGNEKARTSSKSPNFQATSIRNTGAFFVHPFPK